MKKRLKKLLVHWLLPTAGDITTFVVDNTANFINGSGKEEVIAKYGTYADNFT